MRRIICLLLLFALLSSTFLMFSCSEEHADGGENGSTAASDTAGNEEHTVPAGKVFYVSTDGSDDNDGSEDKPLLTIDGARKAVSEYRKSSGIPEGGIEVVFAPGTYRIDHQTVFTAEDSGEEGRAVVYRASGDGEVLFDGGITIDPSLFVPASDDIIQIFPFPHKSKSIHYKFLFRLTAD